MIMDSMVCASVLPCEQVIYIIIIDTGICTGARMRCARDIKSVGK